MMNLAAVSSYFDRTPVYDPDTGALLFYGQVDPFDDSRRESATGYRRILSVADSVTIPTARVVKIHNSIWVVGTSEEDGWLEVHRRKFVLHPASYRFKLSTLPNFLAGVIANYAWCGVEWYKDGKEESTSSRSIPKYTAYFSSTFVLQEYDIIWLDSGCYLVETPHQSTAGFTAATCSKLEFVPASATVATRTYDPAQGKYVSSTTATKSCLRVRWQDLFLYGSQASAHYQEGDCSLVLPSNTAIATKDVVTLSGITWNVISVGRLGGAVVAHGRPA